MKLDHQQWCTLINYSRVEGNAMSLLNLEKNDVDSHKF